jgi:hypothetical protein
VQNFQTQFTEGVRLAKQNKKAAYKEILPAHLQLFQDRKWKYFSIQITWTTERTLLCLKVAKLRPLVLPMRGEN